MLKAKSKLQVANRTLILIFSLMIAYIFTWPLGANHTSHMLDDRSYMNCHGTLARPVEVDYRGDIQKIVEGIESGEPYHEYITLPAGTEIIYICEDDKPVFINLYSEQGMLSSVRPHDYSSQELSVDDLVNPEEVEQNLIRVTNEKAERQAEYETAKRYYKYMFVPYKLVYAIPIGIVIFALLCSLENKFKKPQFFTIEMSVIILLVGFVELLARSLLSAACL